jgi:competence protein ComEC
VSDGEVVTVALATVAAAVWGTVAVVLGAAVVAGAVRRVRLPAACAVLGLLAALAAGHAWASVQPRTLGPFRGWATVAADPAPLGTGLRTTLRIGGERFDAWTYGAMRAKVAELQAGQQVWVTGERKPLTGDVRRAQVRHVVGRFAVQAVGDVIPGNGVARAGNRVRSALRRSAAATMGPADAALFTGLVIGDDSQQPRWMLDRFRSSGLSHLTAVSGQNVAFLLAAALPLLRRLRPWWRWLATVALIAWFMSVTRFEPSVLRAGVMAMLAATAFVLGRQPRPLRLVAIAVTVLVLTDPMLVWSVGFWLSVGATVGVCVAGPWWTARLPGPLWLRRSVGVTLGAQVGVALPSLLVFHRLPLVSPLANLAAVPVAGFVMLYGLPAGLLGAALPAPLRRLVMAPAVLGTRWTATVAAVAARLEPGGTIAVVGWLCAAVVALVLVMRGGSRSAEADVPF